MHALRHTPLVHAAHAWTPLARQRCTVATHHVSDLASGKRRNVCTNEPYRWPAPPRCTQSASCRITLLGCTNACTNGMLIVHKIWSRQNTRINWTVCSHCVCKTFVSDNKLNVCTRPGCWSGLNHTDPSTMYVRTCTCVNPSQCTLQQQLYCVGASLP